MATAKSKSYTRTTHTISETINGVDHEFEVEFEPSDYQDIHVIVSDDGMKAVVGYLCRDDMSSNPRKEFDHIGKMVCWHGRYNLGDEQPSRDADEYLAALCDAHEDFSVWVERLEDRYYKSSFNAEYGSNQYKEHWREFRSWVAERRAKILEKYYIMLPLYLYDHSGITMSTGSFSCPWDSGQVGFIYMTKKDALDNWGGKILTKNVRDKAIKCLEAEVKEYDYYLTGDVWGVCTQCFVNVGTPEEPEWEAAERVNKDNRVYGLEADECWGYYGDKYAEEELKSEIEWRVENWLNKPQPVPDDPAQPGLFEEVGL